MPIIIYSAWLASTTPVWNDVPDLAKDDYNGVTNYLPGQEVYYEKGLHVENMVHLIESNTIHFEVVVVSEEEIQLYACSVWWKEKLL